MMVTMISCMGAWSMAGPVNNTAETAPVPNILLRICRAIIYLVMIYSDDISRYENVMNIRKSQYLLGRI